MAGVIGRIEQSSDRLVADAFELDNILADGEVDTKEVQRLLRLAQRLKEEAVRVEDVALDIQTARQVLQLGRASTPNRHLRDREQRVESLLNRYLAQKAGKAKAITAETVIARRSNKLEGSR